MVSAPSDVVSNVSFQNARSKSSRDDQASLASSFSSLVDSNTALTASSDRSLTAQQPDLPAPAPTPAPARRDDNRPTNDNASRTADAPADREAAPTAQDRGAQTTTPAQDAPQNTTKTGKDDTKVNAEDSTKKDSKTKDASAKDADAQKTDNSIATPTDQPVAVTAVAVAVPVPAVAGDATVKTATPGAGGAAQPLAIAAAVLKAQTAATDAAATATDTATTTTSAEGDATFAALIASATPASGKAGAKKTGTSETATITTADAKSNGTTDTAAATSAQGTDASTLTAKAAGDGKLEATSADGAKPDASAATADAAKPATSKAHDQGSQQTVQAPAPDVSAPNSNNILQPQLQPTAVAAPPPQLTATVATSAAIPFNGVAVEIAQSAKAGKSSFDIRLDPAELGRIDVRLDVDKHGNVTSHLTVEKPETLAMLRQDAPQLQRALEQAGLKTNDSGMQFSLRDQSSGQQQQQSGDGNSGRNPHRLIIGEDDSIPAVSAGRGYGRMLGSSSGVDISI